MEGNFKKWLNRINSKQDVLTDDNVGEFMDLKLSTKLTPTSGDTVLAMDSVTGKAVKIPTDQFGGGGSGGDTSNLVPYTGANKHVNIGAYYFESSLGFKKTGGTASQYLMADGSTSTLPTDLIRGTGTTNSLSKFTSNGTIGNSIVFDNGTNVGIGTTSPSEKLDVNGNVKATQIKDQYGTLQSQRTIPITGNITLSETHNGAILHVTNTCNITIPTGLDANFQCVVYAKGSIIVTFVNGGVTLNSPSGLLLKTDKMASLYANASNTFNLLGELATS